MPGVEYFVAGIEPAERRTTETDTERRSAAYAANCGSRAAWRHNSVKAAGSPRACHCEERPGPEAGVRGHGQLGAEFDAEVVEDLLEDLAVELFLRREVAVDDELGHPAGGADVVHGGLGESGGREGQRGAVEDGGVVVRPRRGGTCSRSVVRGSVYPIVTPGTDPPEDRRREQPWARRRSSSPRLSCSPTTIFEPLFAGSVRCHGGFDPRAATSRRDEVPAPPSRRGASQLRAVLHGVDRRPARVVGAVVPERRAGPLPHALRGARPLVATLTRIGTVEGFGANIRLLQPGICSATSSRT